MKTSFSFSIPNHWISKFGEKTIDEPNKILELRSHNDIDLHVKQVKKQRITLMLDNFLSSLKTFKKKYLKN